MDKCMTDTLRLSLRRFSVRTAFAVTASIAVFFAHIAHRENIRRQLISEIEESGGSVKIDDSLHFAPFKSERVTAVTIPHSALAKIGAHRLTALPNLATLTLQSVDVTDSDVQFEATEVRFANVSSSLLDRIDHSSMKQQSR